MRIWTFDPGAVQTGLAYVSWYGQPWFSPTDMMWWQSSSVEDLYEYMEGEEPAWRDVFIVEDFSHGGAFTLEAKQTIEIVGFLTRQLAREGYKVVRRHKDKRLSGQGQAAQLMGSTVGSLKTDPARKDAFSALSHCITYTREVEPQ